MPNYCFNNLRLRHEDPAMITRVIDAYRAGTLLQEFIPAPDPDVSIDWTAAHWGTKWEIESAGLSITSLDPHEVTLDFDTANNPPLPLYACLRGLDFQVIAVWAEMGCRFCGSYGDTGAVRRYDIPFTEKECREQIPDEISNAFDICEYVAESEGN